MGNPSPFAKVAPTEATPNFIGYAIALMIPVGSGSINARKDKGNRIARVERFPYRNNDIPKARIRMEIPDVKKTYRTVLPK
jgi:hypothetical protein